MWYNNSWKVLLAGGFFMAKIKREIKTMDGNNAAAWASYPFTETAAIYPITPSSTMAEVTDQWTVQGKKNIFNDTVKVVEMQSEAGVAGTVHGLLSAGALTTTYTASQGLLLMIPNMYKIAGELLPCVINVSARCIATHALSIFGDHSDVYACRQTGFAMLCESNPQEVMDLTAVAHLSTIKGKIPFINFFDGFRTSHEIQKVEVWDNETLEEMLDKEALNDFRKRALNPNHPVLKGSAQNPDIFFQNREACNSYYNALPEIIEDYMNKVNEKLGTDYKLFNYYGDKNAEQIIIAMGSVNDTIEETIDYLNEHGEKLGLVKVRLYRPFCIEKFIKTIPETVKKITVLDRTKEAGAVGEPLYVDVVSALKDSKFSNIPIFSGRYGLASKDTTPAQIKAVFDNNSKKVFTIGIDDDVTHLSLKIDDVLDSAPKGTTSCKFWGLGADGTVGANKNSIKIIGDHTDKYVQAYFSYDSKKSGGLTISDLRFGDTPIKSTYLINSADFVACHKESYIKQYDVVSDIKPNGTFLLNTSWNFEELEKNLPANVKKYIAENNINFYTINGNEIAEKIGMGNRINTILQSAFFKLSDIIPFDNALKYMKEYAEKSYSRKGKEIVERNWNAIDAGWQNILKIDVPENWKNISDKKTNLKVSCNNKEIENFVNNIQIPCNTQKGNELPVSAFKNMIDGTLPQGTSAFEKRGIAVKVPQWIPENCIQCNQCSYSCPHAVIRPAVFSTEDLQNKTFECIDMKPNVNGYKFAVTVSVLDCTGCGVCANTCPAKEKALVMKPINTQLEKQKVFDYGNSLERKSEVLEKFSDATVKGSQFRKPLLEFSGACAGCGETPYAKLVTQLFGERMYIANATGCSSIWGGSAPSTPYTFTSRGKGVAWANSLFEDNAEFGFGIYLAQSRLRERVIEKVKEISAEGEVKIAIENYLATIDNGDLNLKTSEELVKVLEKDSEKYSEILKLKDYLNKKSVWIFGGDGWAYDIGFSGLDHILSLGENVNILVFDTEVYSNTGGQASKSTPVGAVAHFASGGKSTHKKDLAGMAMTYGNVYVAHIALGANMTHCVKTIKEAEAYNGTSLIIAYAPCIAHGIKSGMSSSLEEEKKAVESGYWNLFRYNPSLEKPFTLDSKAPDISKYNDFLMGEVRYSTLMSDEKMLKESENSAEIRYRKLEKYNQ